ncbi:MAG TPA: helix-turn-helix transcriptional regulator [Myxococcaceae bacterium]|nr:helix-turn-helix transcriptional regulator [Myxococcaceae bacterium]
MRDSLAVTIGDAARAARERLGLTQAEVAGLMDLSPIVYNRLERAKMLPSVMTLVRLSETLETSPAELLGFTQPVKRGNVKPSQGDAPSLHQLVNLARKLDETERQTLITMAKTLLRK